MLPSVFGIGRLDARLQRDNHRSDKLAFCSGLPAPLSAGCMHMSPADYFDDLQKRIMGHPGKPVFDALQAYDRSRFVLDGNSTQLRQLICVLEDPKDPAQIDGIHRRPHLQWFFGDANRHFHNFLTSITTVVDHTRNLMKEDFIKPAHRHEYQNRVNAIFATDPLTQFLQDFRNYITHYAIPQIVLEKKYARTDLEPKKLFIDLEHLERRFHWSSPSRKFIETNKPQIRMLKLVDDHELKSKSFYKELMLTFQKHLGNELSEVRSMMLESNNLLKNGW
jgi:hypothetical protein